MKKSVLVTGANSQLAKTIKELCSKNEDSIVFTFLNRIALDITDKSKIIELFSNNEFDYCINCAAYTDVDKAEDHPEDAFLVNAEAVKNIAEVCKQYQTVLIHVSTDYVFDGKKSRAYIEEDATNPINKYGASKLDGEINIKNILTKYFIIRTSWLYSEYGTNFVKTMLRLAKTNTKVSVVDDQISAPTYARDLAEVILNIILQQSQSYGLYHYSNKGQISWFDFAKEIFDQSKSKIQVSPTTSDKYRQKAKRPAYSLLEQYKINKHLGVESKPWKVSLGKSLKHIGS